MLTEGVEFPAIPGKLNVSEPGGWRSPNHFLSLFGCLGGSLVKRSVQDPPKVFWQIVIALLWLL